MTENHAAPEFEVLRGAPTAGELAAVVVVLRAAAGRGSGLAAPAAARSQWAARSRLVRSPVLAGPGAWRASALPR